MSKVREFEREMGGRWTGVIFHKDGLGNGKLPERPMRFCEAVAQSRTEPVVLTRDLIQCPGASRSLGWDIDDDAMAQAMAEKTGFEIEPIRKVIAETPHLGPDVAAVTVGTYDAPDIVLTCAQCDAAMKLVRQWQQRNGTGLDVELSSVMSVCGSVAVKTYLTGKICMSFGCPGAREYGNIGRDRMIVGVPSALVEQFL